MKKLQCQCLFALIAVLLSACGGRQSSPQADGDTLQLKYASLLTIVRHDGYTEAVIRNPWKEGRVLHSYLLVPRGESLPEGLPHGSVVRTPVQRAAVFTTVHCSLLTTLGLGERIAAVADLKYIKIPYVQQRVCEGHIADCGGGMNPTVERIIDVKPDIIMLSPFENSGGYGKLEDIDIPLVECAEYMEPSPLARAEWMKFYGLLFGEYDKADSLFQVVDQHYQTLKTQAAKAGNSSTRWSVPCGTSPVAIARSVRWFAMPMAAIRGLLTIIAARCHCHSKPSWKRVGKPTYGSTAIPPTTLPTTVNCSANTVATTS